MPFPKSLAGLSTRLSSSSGSLPIPKRNPADVVRYAGRANRTEDTSVHDHHNLSDEEILSLFYNPAGTAESITQIGRTRKSRQSVPMVEVKRVLSDAEKDARGCFDQSQQRDADSDHSIKRASPHAMKRLRREVYAHNSIWESRRMLCDDGRRRRLPQALFITLTYPPEFAGDEQQCKTQLKEFCRRAIRAFPGTGGFWVMEYQRSGVIHFHLLLWRGADMHWIDRRRVSATWADIIAPPDAASQHRARLAATNVRPCTHRHQVAEYVAKEVSKHLQKDGTRKPGRFWGKFGIDNIAPHRFEKVLMSVDGDPSKQPLVTATAEKIHRVGCLQFARRCPRAIARAQETFGPFGKQQRIGCASSATGRMAKKCLPPNIG